MSPYLVQMRENKDQNNSEYGHISRSVYSSIAIANETIIYQPTYSLPPINCGY